MVEVGHTNDQMLKLHPLRMNVNALWTSALAIEGLTLRRLRLCGTEQSNEFPQVVVVDIRHRPDGHAVLDPMTFVKTSDRSRIALRGAIIGGPDHHADHVQTTLVDERRDRPSVNCIKAAAQQRKAARAQIPDGRRKIELALKPRLYRVSIRRPDGEELGRQRIDVTGDECVRDG